MAFKTPLARMRVALPVHLKRLGGRLFLDLMQELRGGVMMGLALVHLMGLVE